MNPKIIPRKHRKYVIEIIEMYKKTAEAHLSWNRYLQWMLIGSEDGWLITNNREYRALLWLIEVQDMVRYLRELEGKK